MPINELLARGVVPLGEGVPNVLFQIAQLREAKARDAEYARRTQVQEDALAAEMKWKEQDRAVAEKQRLTAEQDAKARALLPLVEQGDENAVREVLEGIATQNPQVAAALQANRARAMQMPGATPAKVNEGLIASLRSALGEEVAKPDIRTVGDSIVQIGPDGARPIYTAPPRPQQYAPAGYREVTLMENGVPTVYMVNERNPGDRRKLGEAPSKGGGGGVMVGPDGTLIAAPDPAKATEGERVSANYLGRMEASEQLLGNYVPGVKDYTAARIVMQGGPVAASAANSALSVEGQQYYQAAADWVRAKLRKESGAVISPQEMEQEIKTYFPVPGDSQQVIEQKRQARQQAMDGMRLMGGRAAPVTGQSAQQGGVVDFNDL
jgi:hypothetical protein